MSQWPLSQDCKLGRSDCDAPRAGAYERLREASVRRSGVQGVIDVSPPKAALVFREGLWYEGLLEAWRKDDQGVWLGFVRYHMAVGMQYLEWMPAESIGEN